VLFGNLPSGQPLDAKSVTNALADRALRSIWFESGFDYTLSGLALGLGKTLGDGERLITVLNHAVRHSEITFAGAINISTANPSHHFLIYNESQGGLRFNGAFNTGGHSLWIEGPAATQFSGVISGVSGGAAGEIRVNTKAGGHAVFAADNSGWGGSVHVDSGMAVVTADGALGSASVATTVADGATLAFRQKNWGSGTLLDYAKAKTLELSGAGTWRWGEGHVGALYNDGGNNHFRGAISLLGSNVAIGSRSGWLHLAGGISGNASLTKVGRGIIALSNTGNAYTGATIIREGGLWIVNEAALQGGFGHASTGTNVVLDGGVLILSTSGSSWDDFNRQLGTGAGQIQWTGSGGFANGSGFGAYIQLRNEDGISAGTLTWGKDGFVPIGSALLFGTEGTGGIVNIRNSFDLAGGMREFNVHRNTVGATIGTVTNGGVIKTGAGSLNFRGGDLNYTGPTEIRDGLFFQPLSSYTTLTNFQLAGGSLSLSAVGGGSMGQPYAFEAHLGSGAGQVQWLAGKDGGLAVVEGQGGRLRINGSTDAITWGQQYFVGLDNTLILGWRNNTSTLDFDTGLNLAGGERTIHVARSLVTVSGGWQGADIKFTQALSNGSLRLVGDGRLDLAVANADLKGSVTVNGAELRLNAGGTLSAISALRVERGGRVTLDNAGTSAATAGGGLALDDRINKDATVTLDAGTLRFWGGTTAGSQSSQTLGALTLAGGASTIDVVNHAGANGSASLQFASLSRSDATATINFTNSVGAGTYSNGTTGPRLSFVTAPSLSGGILPYATVHGSDWATVTTGGDLVAYTGYQSGAPTDWLDAHNVSIDQNLTASGSLTINSLRFAQARSLNLQSTSDALNLTSGGLLAANIGGGSSSLQFGRLTTDADNLYIHVANDGLDLSTAIFGDAGLVKTGLGRLVLSGAEANTYTGTTFLNEGVLFLAKLAGVDALAGDLVVGDFGRTATVVLSESHQIADTATVTLRGVMHALPTTANYVREGVLQFNNGGASPGIREAFDRLHIDGRGVINFHGGEIARRNYLILNHLSFADAQSRLIIRSWVEFEDFLLVRRSGNESLIPPLLGQIDFAGYGPARWVPYDNDYWLITPFPEPSTYGALLGVVGLGLWAWRKRKTQNRSTEHN